MPAARMGSSTALVYDGPVFKYPIPFVKGEIVYKEYKTPRITY